MFGKVLALEPNDMSNQQFSVLSGHLNKSPVEPVGALRVGNRIYMQHFELSGEDHLVRKAQGTGQDLVRLMLIGERDAEAASADIDSPLDECRLCRIRFPLQANRKRDGDAIVLSTISW